MENEDKLLSFHEKLTAFFDRNLRVILLSIFALIGIGIIWGGITYYNSKKEKRAALKLMEAVKSPDIIRALKEVKDKYKGTSAALQASLLLWNYYFQEKEYAKMQDLLKELKSEYPAEIKGVILYGEAKVLENQNKWKESLKTYKEVIKKEPELNFLTYLDIARAAEKIGNFALAKKYYEKYLKEFPSEEAGLVEYKLSQLIVKK